MILLDNMMMGKKNAKIHCELRTKAMKYHENIRKAEERTSDVHKLSAEIGSTDRKNLEMQLKLNVLSMAQIQVHGN